MRKNKRHKESEKNIPRRKGTMVGRERVEAKIKKNPRTIVVSCVALLVSGRRASRPTPWRRKTENQTVPQGERRWSHRMNRWPPFHSILRLWTSDHACPPREVPDFVHTSGAMGNVDPTRIHDSSRAEDCLECLASCCDLMEGICPLMAGFPELPTKKGKEI